MNPFAPVEPEDPYVLDLIAAGVPKFKAELIAVKHRRIGAAPLRSTSDMGHLAVFVNPFGEPAPPPDPNAPPPCPYGARHIAGRYGRDNEGKIVGFCKCGYYSHDFPCPHKVQRGGRNVDVFCADCGKKLIGNTGFSEDEKTMAAATRIPARTVITQAPSPDAFRP